MAVYVIQPIWGSTWIGASETYITPDSSPARARTLFLQLQQMRMALLPFTAYVYGWRWSIYGGNRRSVVLRPAMDAFPPDGNNISILGEGSIIPAPGEGWPPLMNVSLQVNVSFDTPPRAARKYLDGIPTTAIGGQPITYNRNGNVQWSKDVASFYRWLESNGFQIVAQNVQLAPRYTVAAVVTQPAPGTLLGVTINANAAPTIVQGTTVLLQHFLAAKGTRAATLNGHWSVDSITFTPTANLATIFLRGSQNIDPTLQRFTAKTIVMQKLPGLYAIQELSSSQITGHKRGKAGGPLRGRRLTRASLDP